MEPVPSRIVPRKVASVGVNEDVCPAKALVTAHCAEVVEASVTEQFPGVRKVHDDGFEVVQTVVDGGDEG
jgi:hypothetical protein